MATAVIQNQSPQVRLPGRIFRRRGRWWWKVQLPGQAAPRDRALRPEGSRYATSDRQLAEEIAFAIWQEALRAETEAKVRIEHAARAQRLKLHYRERMNALKDVIGSAEARAEAESAARAKLQARLDDLRNQTPQTAPCECCGSRFPDDQLQRIDSGQRLCVSCLDMLRQAARRQRPAIAGPGSPENL
jgi:hypothetical protein